MSGLLLHIRALHSCARAGSGYGSRSNLGNFLRTTLRQWSQQPIRSDRLLKAARLGGLSLAFAVPICRVAYCRAHTQTLLTRRAEHLSKKLLDVYKPELALSDFWKLLRPYIAWLAGAVLAALVTAIINIQVPIFLGDLVNVISDLIADRGVSNHVLDLTPLKPIGAKIAVAYVVQALTTFFYISFLSIMGERMAADLRRLLFQRLLLQDIGFYDEQRTGELNARLCTDVQEFKSCFKLTVSQGLRTFTQVGGSMISMYLISPKMALLTLSVLPAVILCGSVFGAFLRQLSSAAQAQNGVVAAVADEAFSNIRTVRAFAMEDQEMSIFNKEVMEARRINEYLGVGIGAFQGATNLFLNGVVLAVLYGGAKLISTNELDPGGLMSFLVTAQMIQRSLGQLSVVFGQAVKGFTAAARVFDFVNLPSSSQFEHGASIPLSDFTGAISFEKVTFSYPTRPGHIVLEDFNLDVKPGKVLALCGPSGQGKSTLGALLVRFYEPESGRILLDGVDIKTLDPSWLRRSIFGLISQEPVLFATSIEENIRYGRPDATDAEIRAAARCANADSFISEFPDGYQTVVGERGVTLSGGQKQRIAIARALLKDPPILILDEATSALDYESERLVQDALQKAIRGRTVILIAHRLSTIRNADCIAVIKNGQIVESGSHQQLTRNRGLYYELTRAQDRQT